MQRHTLHICSERVFAFDPFCVGLGLAEPPSDLSDAELLERLTQADEVGHYDTSELQRGSYGFTIYAIVKASRLKRRKNPPVDSELITVDSGQLVIVDSANVGDLFRHFSYDRALTKKRKAVDEAERKRLSMEIAGRPDAYAHIQSPDRPHRLPRPCDLAGDGIYVFDIPRIDLLSADDA